MTSPLTVRERFQKIMACEPADRAPCFSEGIRPEVLDRWREQGMPPDFQLFKRFVTDPRMEIETDLDPRPLFPDWRHCWEDLDAFRRSLDSEDSDRLPDDWPQWAVSAKADPAVRMLRVHRGFFLSMGVLGWNRFYDLMRLIGTDPETAKTAMKIQGEFAAVMAEKVLKKMEIDAAIFSEPIGGNTGPLISPAMYEDIVLTSYRPLMNVLQRFHVETVVFRTYANARILIPRILKHGFNCLWACEVHIPDMDYRDLRREFGKDLRLIGGIDLDCIRRGKAAIDRELNEKLPQLLQQGGFAPLADGRIREDVPFENYVYYREKLEEITGKV